MAGFAALLLAYVLGIIPSLVMFSLALPKFHWMPADIGLVALIWPVSVPIFSVIMTFKVLVSCSYNALAVIGRLGERLAKHMLNKPKGVNHHE